MYFFNLCIYRDQGSIFFNQKKVQIKPVFKNSKLFLENFGRKKRRGIKSYPTKFPEEKKKILTGGPWVNLNKFDVEEIILKILLGVESFNHIFQEKKKIQIQIDVQDKLISFKILDLGIIPFNLKKALEIILRPKFSFLQNKSIFMKKIKAKKKNFFFRSNSILKKCDKVEISSRPNGSSGLWGIANKNGKTIKFSKIYSVAQDSSLTIIKLHLKTQSLRFLNSETLRKYINEFSHSFSFSISFSGNRSKSLISSSHFKTQKLQRGNFLENHIWLCSPQLVLKEEYFQFFKKLGNQWDHPIGGIHINYTEKVSINFCVLIPKDNFSKKKNNFIEKKKHNLILHSGGKFFPDFSNLLVPDWLSFFRGVIEVDAISLDFEKGILPPTLSFNTVTFHLVEQTAKFLSFVSQKSPRTYAYFWKNFGYLIKMGVFQNEMYLKNFAHLIRFYSTYSRVSPVSIADYVARMKKNQKNIFFLKVETKIDIERHAGLERLKKEKFETILVADDTEEILLKLIEKEQKNVNRKKLKFQNIESLETSFNFKKKKLLKTEKLKKLKIWYTNILKIKNLRVFLSESFDENISAFSETKLTRAFSSKKFSGLSQNSDKKNFFFTENSSMVFEVSPFNKLIKLISFYVISDKSPKFIEQIGALIWELTYLNYGSGLPNNLNLKKRTELILCFLLIAVHFIKKSKK